MHIERFVCNPFQENCYVVSDFAADKAACLIIDCGAYYEEEWEAIRRYIDGRQLRPVAHLLTHAHLDHLFGARYVEETYGLLPMLSAADETLFRSVPEQARLFGIPLRTQPLEIYLPLPEDTLLLEGTRITLVATPGHTPGGVCYLFPDQDDRAGLLFSGDTLFQAGYGRTDLPGGDYVQLMSSLARLQHLPAETIVLPGHGGRTTIADESSNY